MLNLLLALLLCFQEEPKFPAHQGTINDFANIMTEEAKNDLRAKVAALRDNHGPAVVVVTTPSLYGLTVEDYTNQLFKKWGIGSKKEDNGVLLLIAPNERKARIEVGYGLEGKLTDLEAKAILTEVVRPLFRAGKVSESVVAGTEALIAKLGGTTAGPPAQAPTPQGDTTTMWILLAVVGVVVVIILIMIMTSGGSGYSSRGYSSYGGGGSDPVVPFATGYILGSSTPSTPSRSSSDDSSSRSSHSSYDSGSSHSSDSGSSSFGGGDSGGGGASSDL